jgi:Family of unknown function (DUF5397)
MTRGWRRFILRGIVAEVGMQTESSSGLAATMPASFVGSIKTFGECGEIYEVLGVSRPGTDGDTLMRIRLVKTGEEAEYSFLHMLDDPEAV